jgi:hypothetical protein
MSTQAYPRIKPKELPFISAARLQQGSRHGIESNTRGCLRRFCFAADAILGA